MHLSPLKRTLGAAVFIAGLTCQLSLAKADIGLNFGPYDSSSTLLSTDSPGIIFDTNWNNIGNGSGTNVTLHDSNNLTTSALLTFTCTNPYEPGTVVNTPNAGTNRMFTGCLTGNNIASECIVTMTNIPYAQYDVYVYTSTGTSPAGQMSVTDGATTYYFNGDGTSNRPTSILQDTSTDPLNPTLGNALYEQFSNLTSSSFTVETGGSINGVISNNIFGVQVVDDVNPSTPEPGSYALMGSLGLSAFAMIRRRRNR